jgi:hypothetical protein
VNPRTRRGGKGPHVGNSWLVDSQLLIDGTSFNEAEPYGQHPIASFACDTTTWRAARVDSAIAT